MASDDLLAKREKIQREILALESTLGADSSIADLLSSDSNSDDESDESGPVIEGDHDDLEEERLRIQREIEELENKLGANATLADVLQDSEHETDYNDEDSDDDDLDLPQNVETCLQMNLVYQEVLNEKLAELERLLKENQQQQKEIEVQLSGPSVSSSSIPGLPSQKLFLGYFMKPYFKDRLTGLGPPANPETKERLRHGTRPIDGLKIRRWEVWQKTLLTNAVASDIMKKMLQPKLSKLEYLSAKMSRVGDAEKEELKKQIELIEQEIKKISTLKDDQLVGNRHDDHDWEKISNIDFEGLRQADDLKRFWQNYLHPSINKSIWKQDEIDKLKGIVEKYKCSHWDKIAEDLGTNRTAFMCFQTYQRYISKTFRRKEWTPEEDQVLRDLVKKMRTGNFIPYIQMSYFMEGRDGSQLAYRWTSVLDPTLKKGPWSKEEDQLLLNAVAKYGAKEWGKIRMEVPGRTDGGCRDRYLDCLQENVKKGPWSEDEVELLKQKVEKYGVGKWSKIASEIPSRVDCQCMSKWNLLTKARKKRGIKREIKQTVQRKAKRQKVCRTKRISSSSEDEADIDFMDSDDEPDVPLVKETEIPRKDYVQTDMKEWIPTHAIARYPGTLGTVWVRLPTIEEELQEPSKESGLGRIPSNKTMCRKDGPSLVRNTILNRFGNMERTYLGRNPINLPSQTDDEKAMIKVAERDIRQFLQLKVATVIKKKRKPAQDMHSLTNDILKSITPWIGNVILPPLVKGNQICEGDIVGRKAADIPLPKTSVLLFFIQVFHIDVMGCRSVIEIQQKKGITKPTGVCKPQIGTPGRKMMSPVLIHPTNRVLIRPKMQEAVQHLMLNGQTISVLPQSPPQAMSMISLPLIQQTPPAQSILTSTSKSPSVQDSNSVQKPVNWILTPTNFVQVTGPLSANVPSNQTLNVPNNSPSNDTTCPFTSTNLCPSSSPLVVAASSSMILSPSGNNSWIQMPSSATTSFSQNRETLHSVQRLSQAPTEVDQKGSHVESTKNSSDDSIGETIVRQCQSSPSTGPSASFSVLPVPLTVPASSSGPTNAVAKPGGISENDCFPVRTSQLPTVIQQKSLPVTILRPLWAPRSPLRLLDPTPQIVAPSPRIVAPSPRIVAPSPRIVAPSPRVVAAPSPRIVAPSPRVVAAPSPRIFALSPRVEAPSPWIVTPSPQVFALTPRISAPSPRVAAPLVVPQITKSNEPIIPDLPSNGVSLDPHLMFPDQSSEVDDWIKGKGGIPLPQLEMSLPYLPPSIASVNTLTYLLKTKQSLLTTAVKILPVEHQNDIGEEAQVGAIRKMIAERFASNPAYLLFKARFLSCFTLPALLATINPFEECQSPTDSNDDEDEDEVLHSQQRKKTFQPPVAKIHLNTSENKASAKHFSGISTKSQADGRQVT